MSSLIEYLHRTASSSETVSSDSQMVTAVIAGFEYRWINGIAMPMVLFTDDVGEGAFPLIGNHYLTFSRQWYCSWCGTEVIGSGGMCGRCEASDLGRRLRCIHEGPGMPFEKDCTLDDPPCEVSGWARSVCYAPWMVYIASVCGVPKVGISRMSKDGCELGFTKRLLSQGAGQWVALGPVASLGVALETESYLSEELSITTFVTNAQKVEWIINGSLVTPLPSSIRLWVKKEELPVFMKGDFSRHYELESDTRTEM